jgi:hypothetical protein
MDLRPRTWLLVVSLGCTLPASGFAQQSLPVPQPFPGAGSTENAQPPSSPKTPAPQRPAAAATGQPAPAPARPSPADVTVPRAPVLPTSVPVYPSAEFLETFDAGAGQQYYLFGTNLPYADIVAYYRNVLKTGGHEVYRTPGVYQFDLGRFDDGKMAFPPSIVVKDYQTENSPGYLFVSGTSEKRYRTIIQIVPPGPDR